MAHNLRTDEELKNSEMRIERIVNRAQALSKCLDEFEENFQVTTFRISEFVKNWEEEAKKRQSKWRKESDRIGCKSLVNLTKKKERILTKR
ncbi:hypothetical protein PanWU01x14_349750 [Parasponia andersonii]|uniref:Uncharacterized protein n=1 Tax=Parasponia andersonii TaxID=3476 RepID=A0A2P5AB71_PARAD|nr:hypothetical protein PanWU01x14_349750 [Parasponia andersonii]